MRIEPKPDIASTLSSSIAGAVLDSRLTPGDPAPLVVALSGGGDSLFLLLAVKAWADRRGRPLVAVTVDHRLRPEGADWALWCQDRCRRLGVAHKILDWVGEKPSTGRSAAARHARHRLLADAARDAGAAVILLGHTADDVAEAGVMRRQGSSVPTPRLWSPSPVWPEGRGVFLLRPLLEVRRAELRAALTSLGETWIEDPANQDPASVRARARILLQTRIPTPGPLASGKAVDAPRIPGPPPVRQGPAGDLSIPYETLLGGDDAGADLGAMLLCAAGTDRPPRGESLRRLLDRIVNGERFVATLAGARAEGDGARLHIVADVADARRGAGSSSMTLPVGQSVVWDGRFELCAARAGARVERLAGRIGRLPPRLRRAALTIAPAARPALPLVTGADGVLELPTLAVTPLVDARSLSLSRLVAARGAIMNEAALRRMAKPARAS